MALTFYPVDGVDQPGPPWPGNQRFVWVSGGRIYHLVYALDVAGPPILPAGPSHLRMYYTDDGGVTWTEADSAHRPIVASGLDVHSSSPFQVANIIHIAYDVRVVLTREMRLTTFNMSTALWGTEILGGPTAPVAQATEIMYLTVIASTGTRYVLFSAPGIGTVEIQWVKYDGAWSVPVTVSAGDMIRPAQAPKAALLDTLGANPLIHFFWNAGKAFSGTPVHYYHRALNLNTEVLDATTQDLGPTAPDWLTANVDIGPPVIMPDGRIALPYPRDTGVPSTVPNNPGFEHVPAIFIGTSAGSPTPAWSSEDISSVLAGWVNAHDSFSVGVVATASTLVAYWGTPQHIFFSLNQVYTATRAIPGVWGPSTLYWAPTVPTNPSFDDWIFNPDPIMVGGQPLLFVDRVNASFDPNIGNEYSEAGVVVEAAPPPPPVPVGALNTGGTRRMVVLVPNYWDHCLRAAPPDWKDLPPPSRCCVPDMQSYFKWVDPPQGYRAFRQVGAIPTPLAVAGDVTVLQFMVPFGYDGVIRGMFHKYTGPGFLEGNGDLIWRLQINRVYAKHLGAMLVTVGDVDKPHPVSDGIPLTSRQWIRYIVNAPNLSGGILPVNSSIVCGVEGWFYPRR